jgi:hypothetical protein
VPASSTRWVRLRCASTRQVRLRLLLHGLGEGPWDVRSDSAGAPRKRSTSMRTRARACVATSPAARNQAQAQNIPRPMSFAPHVRGQRGKDRMAQGPHEQHDHSQPDPAAPLGVWQSGERPAACAPRGDVDRATPSRHFIPGDATGHQNSEESCSSPCGSYEMFMSGCSRSGTPSRGSPASVASACDRTPVPWRARPWPESHEKYVGSESWCRRPARDGSDCAAHRHTRSDFGFFCMVSGAKVC